VGSDLEYAIVGAVPFQLLGYHLAVAKGMDPDYPRNLSKTLTVD
jgi:glucosamine--fructose-6-phosphate aminotransferase (isomerizing)